MDRIEGIEGIREVPVGQRGVVVFRLGCKLRRAGVPKEVAARLVVEVVRGWEPGYPVEKAVERVVRAYARWPVGFREEEAMREEESARLDPGLRAIANQAHTATAALLLGRGEGGGFRI